jgi:ATP-dependent DNA ligase
MLRPPIEPMLARSVPIFPEPMPGQDLRLEPKFDGFRVLAFCRPDDVLLQSRAGRDLTRYFPDVVQTLRASMPANVVLDGELVIWDPQHDRTDFGLLQQRITAGRRLTWLAGHLPASLVVFDHLQDSFGAELLTRPLRERRDLLAALLADVPPMLTLCPQTTSLDEAAEWMTAWTSAGVEGVVAKDATSRYTPGKRGWQKYKTRMTTRAIVGGVTGTLARPETVLLGRFDSAGRLRYTGRTGMLPDRASRELGTNLEPAAGTGTHPWPQPLPATWTGQFDNPQPVTYVQVQPTAVVEIEVDTAFERHRWRHVVRYQAIRGELSIQDVPVLHDQ